MQHVPRPPIPPPHPDLLRDLVAIVRDEEPALPKRVPKGPLADTDAAACVPSTVHDRPVDGLPLQVDRTFIDIDPPNLGAARPPRQAVLGSSPTSGAGKIVITRLDGAPQVSEMHVPRA